MMAPLIQETIKSSVASAIESLKTSILQPISVYAVLTHGTVFHRMS